ncbi:hypothetical protein KUTeg_007702 [Tegillarca granosa]|uniref:THAP-type domain-containing protein n=1 Tax=Tegillarca granosa TaxID=220873 RepID=A0ABQ9FI02_TEGGR|nr:hypothetical protein KUTeg_007702 [Tegillarca granosa]
MSGARGIVCVAYGCSNTTLDNVSMHKFPMKNPELLRQLVDFVRSKRKDWIQPSANSTLCSDHFTEDCFPLKVRILESMGQSPPRKKLEPGAVPTIHTKIKQRKQKKTSTVAHEYDETPTDPQKTRMTGDKREKWQELLVCGNTLSHLHCMKYTMPLVIRWKLEKK